MTGDDLFLRHLVQRLLVDRLFVPVDQLDLVIQTLQLGRQPINATTTS